MVYRMELPDKSNNNSIDDPENIRAGAGVQHGSLSLEEIIRRHPEYYPTVQKVFDDIQIAHGVQGGKIEQAIGIYLGDLEPSYILSFISKGNPLDNVLGVLAEWGKCYDQMGLIVIWEDNEDGKGFRYIIELTAALTASDIRIINFVSHLKDKGLSATLRYNQNRMIEKVEYWGTEKNKLERKNAAKIARYLRKALNIPQNSDLEYVEIRQADFAKEKYQVVIIEKKPELESETEKDKIYYDDYINKSVNGRADKVKLGDCFDKIKLLIQAL
jgi:hypothetical protein